LDEGEAVVLTVYPLKIGSQKSEVGKSGYRQVMEGSVLLTS
jgi:hypothetical protein